LFSESKVLHWFVQIALGLHYMHNNKVLHRDLKTQNIFLLGNGRLVLGDLGISKVLDGTMDLASTCIGTPYYMSPEIFKNKPYSFKSDVWALGCVLYEMTSLTHAFDANSLNGLAGKIIKGRYPPIHHKYSKFLRDLISDMLMTNPQQRPDLDQILRKPFIKKHIVNFFVDVMSRPTGSIGEGTMIVRAAVGGSAPSGVSYDNNMLAFKQQLQQLDMMDAVNEALAPKAAPVDYTEAKKLAKEQSNAVRREEDHKRMVEAALEKLRQERESRSKEKAVSNVPQPAAFKPRVSPLLPSKVNDVQPKAAAVIGAAGGMGGRQSSNPPVASNIGQRQQPQPAPQQPAVVNVGPIDAMGVISREKAERERRALEEIKRRQQQEQEARERADERKREETRLEARAREEAAMKQRQDQLRAQADAAAKRDAQRQRERERQQEEIEQLKRDKLELDRRAQERERLRNDRRVEERRKLEENRKEMLEEKQQQQLQIGFQQAQFARGLRAEDKEPVSARERVLQRKQEKLAKDEQDRLEALREAENANRLLRLQANQQNYALYHQGNGNGSRYPANANAAVVPSPSYAAAPAAGYEFDAGRNGKGRPNMDIDELSKRLSEAAPGRPTRYDSMDQPSSSSSSALPAAKNPVRAISHQYAIREDHSDETASEGGDDNDSLWAEAEVDAKEAEEAIHKREEELQAELQMTTQRLETLRKTLKETKTIMGSKANLHSDGSPKPAPAAYAAAPKSTPVLVDDEEDDYFDDEDEYDGVEENEDYDRVPMRAPPMEDVNRTPTRMKPGFRAYDNLQDAPVPSGRLSDRIQLIRQRCIEALGKDAFFAAYNYLKTYVSLS
jgi:hypothetical protein